MNCTLRFEAPDAAFWERYTRLWQESMHASPFQSPHLLQYFAGLADQGLAVFECTEQNRLLAAVVLRRAKGYYTFLSDMKTDANFFQIHRDCTPESVRQIFESFLELTRKERIALMLNSMPAWANYAGTFDAAVQASPLYHLQVNYSVCPMAVGETPEQLFKEVSASRNTRYKVNKFTKQENGFFEVLTDDEGIDEWVEAFCDAHVARWAPTNTPSAYRNPERRQFLADCLRAWYADGVLVRFALRSGNKRIGFLIGLTDGETLIYHSPTFNPDYAHVSPGRALIYFITQWMAENKLRILDFGDGNEAYKYYVASQDQVLQRVFISDKSNLAFRVKTRLIKSVRENPKWYNLYQNKIRPAYRNLFR